MPLLERDDSLLLVIDAQERFYPATREDVDVDRLHASFDRTGWLAAAAAILGIPIVVTEEEADVNGATDGRIAAHLPPGTPVLDKRYFGAPDNPDIEMLSAKAVFYDWVRGVAELYAVCEASDVVRHPPGFHL